MRLISKYPEGKYQTVSSNFKTQYPRHNSLTHLCSFSLVVPCDADCFRCSGSSSTLCVSHWNEWISGDLYSSSHIRLSHSRRNYPRDDRIQFWPRLPYKYLWRLDIPGKLAWIYILPNLQVQCSSVLISLRCLCSTRWLMTPSDALSGDVLNFCMWLKLSQYAKIPPRHTVSAQVVGRVIGTIVCVSILRWQVTIPNVCTPDAPFRFYCPTIIGSSADTLLFGTLGFAKTFGVGSPYGLLLLGMPLGSLVVIAIWFAVKKFPSNRWLRQVHPALLFFGPAPPYSFAYSMCSLYISMISWQYLRKRYLGFWSKVSIPMMDKDRGFPRADYSSQVQLRFCGCGSGRRGACTSSHLLFHCDHRDEPKLVGKQYHLGRLRGNILHSEAAGRGRDIEGVVESKQTPNPRPVDNAGCSISRDQKSPIR